ncbi:unnamed protein product [Schistosoma curassoni]|uniref:Uncharacterized protein n=1 Tax=Schistosoma curassoni TaxID=6186 RepID=A0A183JCT8_9TREM|nr:unnamed protein product [Schistosoma curassoni]
MFVKICDNDQPKFEAFESAFLSLCSTFSHKFCFPIFSAHKDLIPFTGYDS